MLALLWSSNSFISSAGNKARPSCREDPRLPAMCQQVLRKDGRIRERSRSWAAAPGTAWKAAGQPGTGRGVGPWAVPAPQSSFNQRRVQPPTTSRASTATAAKEFRGQGGPSGLAPAEPSKAAAAEPGSLRHHLPVSTSPNSHRIYLPPAQGLLSLLKNFCSPGCFHQKSFKVTHLVLC